MKRPQRCRGVIFYLSCEGCSHFLLQSGKSGPGGRCVIVCSPRMKSSKSQPKCVRLASKHVPAAFASLGGAPNHAPVHFVKSPVAQAHGLEHPKISGARQARSKIPSCVDLQLLVRGLGTFSLKQKMTAQGPGEKKSEHSSHETLKKASRTPSESLQTTPCL